MHNPRVSRADLHVHSKYSDRPSEWFLRRVGAPECFVEPAEVYRRARERDMDFVTLADHNSIRGALEIAHLAHTFISSEITTYFPEDGCKVHCLVVGIDEAQFRIIDELRPNIYELRRFVDEEGVIASVTHPLFRVNDRLTIDHVEKLLVMFKRFETINGMRDRRGAILLQAILDNLTPERLAAMAERHELEPCEPRPWDKWTTGGSDDHSGEHIGAAYTTTLHASTVTRFLTNLREGRHEAAGTTGGSLLLAQSLYHIAYGYYKSRFLKTGSGQPSILGDLLERLVEQTGRKNSGRLSRLVPGFAKDFLRARRLRKLNDVERLILGELPALFRDTPPSLANGFRSEDRRAFQTACRVAHPLGYSLLRKIETSFREGRVVDAVQALASLGTVAMGVAPYLAAFSTQHKDDAFLRTVSRHFPEAGQPIERTGGIAWITDTFADVNGVGRTIHAAGTTAKAEGRKLTVVTCLDKTPKVPFDLVNHLPVGTFRLPEYESQTLAFPPFLEVIEQLERGQYRELVISTPGPMGLTALAAGRLLGIPRVGVYHTDLPLFVRHLTRDQGMEQLAWKLVHWFYSQMDTVLVPSQYYRRHLTENGFDASRLAVMEHGVDLDQFHPSRRVPNFWRRFGLNGRFTFLYAGRVSREKNLERMLEAFQRLRVRLPWADLAVVGDGPSLPELKAKYRSPRIAYTGFLGGDELSAAYASADVLVFPSMSDTFGMAVLEANASGLPAIVSNWGAPAEIVERHRSGLVADMEDPAQLSDAMRRLAEDPALRARCQEAALRNARAHAWEAVFEVLWNREPPPADVKQWRGHAKPGAERQSEMIVMDVA